MTNTDGKVKPPGNVVGLMQRVKWVRAQKLSVTPKAVLMAIALRCDAKGTCWPSLRQISEDTGVTRRSVIRAISQLREARLVESETRLSEAGRPRSSVYQICIENVCGDSDRNDCGSSDRESPGWCQTVTPIVTECHQGQCHSVTTVTLKLPIEDTNRIQRACAHEEVDQTERFAFEARLHAAGRPHLATMHMGIQDLSLPIKYREKMRAVGMSERDLIECIQTVTRKWNRGVIRSWKLFEADWQTKIANREDTNRKNRLISDAGRSSATGLAQGQFDDGGPNIPVDLPGLQSRPQEKPATSVPEGLARSRPNERLLPSLPVNRDGMGGFAP